MFFLLRAAFWLAILFVLLPGGSGTDDKDPTAPRVSALQAISAAGSAISDVSQFCDRKPDACATGRAALHVFAEKVGSGIRMLSSYASHGKNEPPADASTLTPDDVNLDITGSTKRSPAG